ncbi:MAG: hypothetical protein OXI49_08125 [Acidobacteriota bacterium]|nr:hypothetical protein [Acidobacteriota bacterium]
MVQAPRQQGGFPGRGPRNPRSQMLWRLGFITLILGMVVVIVIGYVIIRLTQVPGEMVESGREIGRAAVESVERIARAFRTGSVQTSFMSYATEVSGSSFLQFASLDQTEVLERTDSASLLWGRLRLPDVVVEARVPVRYTYYLDLEDEWSLTLEGTTVHVLAPGVRANRPAVDASAIEYRVQGDSILRDEEAVLEQLRLRITDQLAARAGENIALVRELGRRRTADFVRTFLLSQFGEDVEAYRIDVRFRDEVDLDPAVDPGPPVTEEPRL